MKKVCVLLADGFEEIEGLTVVDLLRRAKIYVDTVSIMDDYIVHGAHGINVQTEDLFDEVDFEEFDMVVLPGGMPGTLKSRNITPSNRIRIKSPTLIYISLASIFPVRNVFFRLVKILSIACIFLFPVANHKVAEQHTS